MQKVVTNGLKIDLHIHSACSSLKDGAKVKGNTIANIPLLVRKLDEQQVNLCAITDHDTFSYDMYAALKRAEIEQQVAALVGTGDLCYGSTLFSKPEQNYLNYILNKKEYSNGLDLRNKYAHDTCPLDEKTQQYDYWELQKIMVLIILKINEELCLKTLQQ